MATAAPPPRPGSDNSHRVIITITTLVAIFGFVVLAALYSRGRHPGHRLEELHLQNELQRSGRLRRRKQIPQPGIAPSLLQFIPLLKYEDSSTSDRRTKSLDLEKGNEAGESQTWSFAQSQSHLKAMQATMSEVDKKPPRVGVKGGEGASEPDSELDECPICVQPFKQDEYVRLLPCGHGHHQRCIDPWLVGFSGTCPVW